MSWTEGPAEGELPPPAGPPVNVPWGPPTLGGAPTGGAPSAPAAPPWAQPAPAWGPPILPRPTAIAPPLGQPSPRYAAYGTGRGPVSYAGFWKRLAGLFLDGLLLGVINIPVNLVFQLLSVAIAEATQSLALLVLLFLANLGVNLFIWWRIIPGRIGNSGATVGMSVMNIRLVPVSGQGRVSSGLAFVRALVMGILQFVCLIPVVLYGATRVAGVDLDSDALREVVVPDAFVASIFAFLLLLLYLPALWHLVDRRYQTLYDKLCSVIVIND